MMTYAIENNQSILFGWIIKIKQIRLPKILTQSTDVNYNKKIIRLKKNFLKKEEEE